MSTNGTRDFSNPQTKFVEVNDMLDRKERNTLPTGISASWTTPIDQIDPALIPADKREMILKTQQKELEKLADVSRPVVPTAKIPVPSQGFVLIPSQAIKKLKIVLDKFPQVEVRLTAEQKESLLSELQLMKTPKNMSDAKALIRLSDALEGI